MAPARAPEATGCGATPTGSSALASEAPTGGPAMATGAPTMAGRSEAEARAAHDTRAHVQPGRGSGGRPRSRPTRPLTPGRRHAHQGSPRRTQRQPKVARRTDPRRTDAGATAPMGPSGRGTTGRRRRHHWRHGRACTARRHPDRARHGRRWRRADGRGLRAPLAALPLALEIAVPGARGGAHACTERGQRSEAVSLGFAFARICRSAQRLHFVIALEATTPTLPVRVGLGRPAVRGTIGGPPEASSRGHPSCQLGARPSTTDRGATVRGRGRAAG